MSSSRFEGDDVFDQFLDESFDAKQYASAAIQSRVVGESLEKLAAGIQKLDKELYSQVVSHHSDLLSQATGIETLEGVLQMMQARIDSLQKAIERMKVRVIEPFEKIMTRTAQLQRLQSACDLLRKVIRVIYLVKRLHTLLQGGNRDLAKAAQSLYELLEFLNDNDLKGIQVVEKDRAWVGKARDEIEKQAQTMLINGVESQNPTHIGTALQCYYNLDCLVTRVERLRRLWVNRLQDDVRKCLDPIQITQTKTGSSGGSSGPGRVSMPTPGSSAQWRANLWTRVEQMTNSIDTAFRQIYHLQKVIAKKRDPVTQIAFAEDLCKDKSTLDAFWSLVLILVGEELSVAAHASTFIKQAFESDYPKLLRLFTDLGSRLSQNPPIVVQTAAAVPTDPPKDVCITQCLESSSVRSFDKTLSSFEAAYVTKSLSRLLDSVNVAFPLSSRNPPSRDDIVGIVRIMASELSAVSFDERILKVVSNNVAKAIKMLTAKAEELVSYGNDAKQVSAAPTQAQKTNLAIVNSLYSLIQEVKSSLLNHLSLPEAVYSVIHTALDDTDSIIRAVTDVLVNVIASTVEEILFSMHDGDFSGDSGSFLSDQVPDAPCSAYIAELKDFISRMYSSHLMHYECSDYLEEKLSDMAGRVLDLFIRLVSLIRPLGERGKLRLAADFTQVELAVTPLCSRPTDLGLSYQRLRAFKSLLFSDYGTLASNPLVVNKKLPLSVVIQFLFSASPESLKSPNQLAGWSVRQYSKWLDEHPSEGDRLAMISATLESYVRAIRAEGRREFASQYLVMVEMLTAEKGEASQPTKFN